MAFPDEILSFPEPSTIWDMTPSSSSDPKSSSFGFMDLLSVEDYSPSLFDWLPFTGDTNHLPPPSPATSKLPDFSEMLNAPASPNSTSISSSSNEATLNNANEEQSAKTDSNGRETEGDAGNGDQNKRKKQLRVKKKYQKKPREPKFAFMTKSDNDHLEDGYRWRKYGQKAVKNSPYPRSYYRCTTVDCGVKKRVERSSSDPSVVVTTYEGQHTHVCPTTTEGASTSRPNLSFQLPEPAQFGPTVSPHFPVMPSHQFHRQQLNVAPEISALFYNNNNNNNNPTPLNVASSSNNANFMNINTSLFDGGFGALRSVNDDFLGNNSNINNGGLLEDIIFRNLLEEEEEKNN